MVNRDKTKIRNWVEGDIFALPIKSEQYPEYNGRYLILIKAGVDWEVSKYTQLVRVKITKDTFLPASGDDLNDLEFIKLTYNYYDVEMVKFAKEVNKLLPDKNGLIYKYILSIHSASKNMPKELIYLGNYSIDLKKDEYITDIELRGNMVVVWQNMINQVLQQYEYINLKKADFYQNSEDRKKEIIQQAVELEKKIKKFTDIIINSNSKKMLEKINNEFGKEKDSITYVGEDNEDRK